MLKVIRNLAHTCPPAALGEHSRSHEYHGNPAGIYHFAYWRELGHPHKGVQMSRESFGTRNFTLHRARAVQQYFQSASPLMQTAGLMFQHLFPEVHHVYVYSGCDKS